MRKMILFSAVLSLFLLVPASITWAQTITTQKGLTTAEFNSSQGRVKVYITDGISKGDRVSIGYAIEPAGNNEKQRVRALDELLKSELKAGDANSTGQSLAQHYNPDTKSGLLQAVTVGSTFAIYLTDEKKQTQTIPIEIKPTDSQIIDPASGCSIPSHALTGAPLRISGPFDGDASNTSCSLDNKPLEILAESPRQCIVLYPANAKGVQQLNVLENNRPKCSQPVSAVEMNVSAGKLNLQKGEKTYIDIGITGLQHLPDTAMLRLNNITPGIVIMLPANNVIIPLPPDSVGSGTFNRHFDIESIRTGSFTVDVDLDLPPGPYYPGVFTIQDSFHVTVPPGQTAKKCDCSNIPTITSTGSKGNQFSYHANVTGSCTGACGIGVNTFTKCTLQTITYEWVIDEKSKDGANIVGANNGPDVTVSLKNGAKEVLLLLNTKTICKDCNTCSNTIGKFINPDQVTEPVKPDTTKTPTTGNPTRERISKKCQCNCKVAIAATGNSTTQLSFSATAAGSACTGVYGLEGNFKPCQLLSATFSWSITSGTKTVSINGAANGAAVKLNIIGSGAYVLTVTAKVTCSDGGTCECKAQYEGDIPPDNSKGCNLIVQESAGPRMDGGLKEKYKGKQTIRRDDFIALGAEGADYDQLTWSCNPVSDCPDTKSEKNIPLNGRVKFSWQISSQDGSGFVKLGCLPDQVKTDEGDNVIFKPPVIPLPVKAADTSVTTTITLSVIDDNPTQPLDPQVDRVITIITKRSKSKPDYYDVEVKSDKYSLPVAPATNMIDGTCKATGPAWSLNGDLTQPIIQLPSVPDNDKMVLGQWIVLTANDQRENDKVLLRCVSQGECPTSPFEKIYEDNVAWEWSVSGGGKFISDPRGRFVIYEAPMDLAKGQDFVDIVFKVKVKNPDGMKIADAIPPEGEKKIRVYQPGIRLSEPDLKWLPEEDNDLEFKSELMYKDGDWKPALAHMCRIHYFELLNVSTEKGVCLNSPVPKDADDCRDLKLKNENKHEAFDDKKAAGKCDKKEMYLQARTQGPEKEYSLKVFSLDFGSYGFLRSFANINKGGKDSIKGEKPVYISIPVKASDVTHPQGRAKKNIYGDNRVTIPYDIDENHIADNGWTTMGGVKVPDPADNTEDEDDKPTGDSFKGDGLSAYEEYRGFKVMDNRTAVHLRTNYKVKDVFVRNENNLDIGLYESLSELDVHEISKDQYIDDDKRFVNFNFNKAMHTVDQRGLHLLDKGNSTTLLGLAYSSTGQPTIPNWEIEIRIYVARIREICKLKKLDFTTKLRAIVAHELLHGNNVCHHGEGDPDVERSADLIHGLRSGDVDCVMRYDNVGTPLSKNPEAIGSAICTSPAGTGYNAGGQHFQDAAKNRGNCKGQVRVSAKGGLPKPCGNR